jgi:hypothetical protein
MVPCRIRPVGIASAREALGLTLTGAERRTERPTLGAVRRSAGLLYRRGMPAPNRPTSEGAAAARRILLDGLGRDADIEMLTWPTSR